MRKKAKRALKYLEKTRVAGWAIDALKDYFNLSEQLILEAEKGELAQIALNQKREKILNMLGVYVNPGITLKTVNFLYNNIDELRKKNGHMSLTSTLFKLQVLFDDIEFYNTIYDCEPRPLYTVTAIKEQQKEINEKYKLTLKS